ERGALLNRLGRAMTEPAENRAGVAVLEPANEGVRPASPDAPSNATPEPTPKLDVRARQVLRSRKIWIAPILLAVVFAAVMATFYLGSVVNPAGHLHGLPVMIVDQDTGAVIDGQHINVGTSLTTALEHSSGVTSRLKLMSGTLKQTQAKMDKAGAFATLVIPATLTRSVLLAAGVHTPGSTPPATAAIELEQNTRLGNLGVSLTSGVINPAIARISPQIGRHISALAVPASKGNPILAEHVANPITLTTSSYRPLPDHSALGLSAFYIALLGLIAGFVGATLINGSVDTALGYASSQLGPRFTQRRPIAINRRQTFVTKLSVTVVAAPILTGSVLLVAVGLLGMYAPNILLLWGLITLAAMMIAAGTLTLLAIFGSIGPLLAMLLLVYLSLASSGGTVPIQALPGVFRTIGHVEPLRNTFTGTRAVLYFAGRGDAGLTTSLIVLACELAFWVALGLAATYWYDHKHLDRISPGQINYINRTVDHAVAERTRRALPHKLRNDRSPMQDDSAIARSGPIRSCA
ncbi:MAG: YhgE/Pip domain-containing protein, partial [Solirubrobacteraceae bacterium]